MELRVLISILSLDIITDVCRGLPQSLLVIDGCFDRVYPHHLKFIFFLITLLLDTVQDEIVAALLNKEINN